MAHRKKKAPTGWPLALAVTSAVVLAAAAAPPVHAAADRPATQKLALQATAAPADEDEQRTRDFAVAQHFFDQLKTLKSHFIQVAPDGSIAEGTFYLSRPNRLRVEYEPPVQQLIIADGWQLIHVDKELDQASYIPLSQTPAAIIARDNLRFDDPDLIIDGYHREANAFAITLRLAKNPDQGAMTLAFTDNPVQLRQWTITDARNLRTRVTLTDPRLNPAVVEGSVPVRARSET